MKRQFETIRESAGRPGGSDSAFRLCLAWPLADRSRNEVTDWASIVQAALSAQTSPLNMTRFSRNLQFAVFDAVNGIERRFTPIYVPSDGPTKRVGSRGGYDGGVHHPGQALSRQQGDLRLPGWWMSFAAIGGGRCSGDTRCDRTRNGLGPKMRGSNLGLAQQ